MGSKTLRMFSTTVLFLGLLVVTYTAPIELDESDSQKLRFESADGVKREEEGSQNEIDRNYEGVGIVPKTFHSYSANSGAVGNIFPPWKRGDPEPHPNPIPAHKRMKTDNHNIVSRTNLDGTDGTKVVVEAKTNRATGDHLPTPPPMPEHKLHHLLSDLEKVGFLAVPKGSYSLISPNGVKLTVNWVADESSFQATGDHLPTPPPMPEHKLKYEVNPKNGYRSVIEKKDDGSYSFSINESGSQRQVGSKPEDSFPDDTVINWVADENGIQAPSDHLLNSNSPPSESVGQLLADLKK